MRASKSDLQTMMEAGEAAIRGKDWDGMRAMIVSLPTGADVTPLLKGLPDDRCPCPHWGYVIKGRLRMIYADGEEMLRAGDVFYMAPGHTGIVEDAVEFVEIAPVDEHHRVLDAMRRNAGVA
jgi:hypothetical protein